MTAGTLHHQMLGFGNRQSEKRVASNPRAKQVSALTPRRVAPDQMKTCQRWQTAPNEKHVLAPHLLLGRGMHCVTLSTHCSSQKQLSHLICLSQAVTAADTDNVGAAWLQHRPALHRCRENEGMRRPARKKSTQEHKEDWVECAAPGLLIPKLI